VLLSFLGISMASLGIGVLIALLSAILFKELDFTVPYHIITLL
jgi:hypothetical protein